jgi:hypothetical protein
MSCLQLADEGVETQALAALGDRLALRGLSSQRSRLPQSCRQSEKLESVKLYGMKKEMLKTGEPKDEGEMKNTDGSHP